MEGAFNAANGFGPEFPSDFGASDDGYDSFDDDWGGAHGGGPPPHAARAAPAPAAIHDTPLQRARLKAVVQGRFSCPQLTSRPEFAAAVAEHREAQAAAGGGVRAVAYGPARDCPHGPPLYAHTTRAFNRFCGARHDFTWWGDPGSNRVTEQAVKFYGFEDTAQHHMGKLRRVRACTRSLDPALRAPTPLGPPAPPPQS